MGVSWGGDVRPADGNGRWRCGVGVEVVSVTDSAVTVEVSCWYQTWWNYLSYSTASVSGPGLAESVEIDEYIAYGTQRAFLARRVAVPRGDADSSASFSASWRQHGGYGDGTGQAWASVSVPARPKYPPAPPASPGASADGSGKVTVKVAAGPASAMQVRRQRSGSEAVETVYDGPAVAAWTDAPGAGTWRYSARLANADGWSSWGAWGPWVAAACAPAAPSLTAPQAGACLDAAAGAPEMRWAHNPKDGSAQTKAQVRTAVDGGEWVVADVAGPAQSLRKAFSAGENVDWQVRTAGASGEWGPWSAKRTFRVRSRPKVEVAPTVVEAVPFWVSWAVTDAAGRQASATVEIIDSSGARAWSRAVAGGASSVEVPARELTPRDGAAYTVRVTVASTTGLTGSGTGSAAVSYTPPGAPRATARVNAFDLSVSVEVAAAPGGADTDSIAVFRDGALVASGLHTGGVARDNVPPLGVPLTYRAVAYSASGAAAETLLPVTVPSDSWACFNFGPGWFRCARMRMNMQVQESHEPEVETMLAPGRALPVAVYGVHTSVRGSVEADAFWLEDMDGAGNLSALADFRELAGAGGDVAMRLPGGERRRVSASVELRRGQAYNVVGVRVDWEEVDGGLD